MHLLLIHPLAGLSPATIPNAMAMASFAWGMDPLSSSIIHATIKLRELDETGGSRFITDAFVSVRLYMPVLTSSLESQEETLAEGSMGRSRRNTAPARKKMVKLFQVFRWLSKLCLLPLYDGFSASYMPDGPRAIQGTIRPPGILA